MNKLAHFWIKLSFLNILIVSAIGVILRYKIAFPLTFIDQKNLLHGHSHFAFFGWISQTLMILLLTEVSKYFNNDIIKRYQVLLWINFISAYGMLISFSIQGYGLFSICFSTFSILNSYVFGIRFWKDLNRTKYKHNSFKWYKAAIIFNVISSFGAFILAYLMATANANQTSYLLSIYSYLHFQYNGWFFFICMGLLVSGIEKIIETPNKLNINFWMFSLSCVPLYLLSILWIKLSIIFYTIVIIAVITQLFAWIWFTKTIYIKYIYADAKNSKIASMLFALSAIALSIKILLQTFSLIPTLSQLAFGFRPIVIGYLHLMLLGFTSIFMFGYILRNKIVNIKIYARNGIFIFVTGIIINEFLLLWQGINSINYLVTPNINIYLFAASIIMFLGLLLLNFGIIKKSKIIKPEFDHI